MIRVVVGNSYIRVIIRVSNLGLNKRLLINDFTTRRHMLDIMNIVPVTILDSNDIHKDTVVGNVHLISYH